MLEQIVRHFDVRGQPREVRPHGTGHINETHLVVCEGQEGPWRYVLQRLNTQIFVDPAAVMENILRVTEHIRAKLEAQGESQVSRRVLSVVPTRQGEGHYQDPEGNAFRVYDFIEGARTYDVLGSLGHAREVARAFGRFQAMLVDLPPPPLKETISRFHDGPRRLSAFQRAVDADSHNRAQGARREIRAYLDGASIFGDLSDLVRRGVIPLRTTHNDTKVNNVMLDDETGQGLCVIDLDTVMPGLSLYDFGDMVRTTASLAAEDERDLERVRLELPRFEAICRGYLEEAGGFLERAEQESLVLGSRMMTLLIGMRFLTDFLEGDTYFRTHRQGHNLDRARAQLKLFQSMAEQEEQMHAVIERALRGI